MAVRIPSDVETGYGMTWLHLKLVGSCELHLRSTGLVIDIPDGADRLFLIERFGAFSVVTSPQISGVGPHFPMFGGGPKQCEADGGHGQEEHDRRNEDVQRLTSRAQVAQANPALAARRAGALSGSVTNGQPATQAMASSR